MFTAEALAISHALNIIKKDIILSESFSTLTSINNLSQPNSIAGKIQNQITTHKLKAMTIIMIWNPGKLIN